MTTATPEQQRAFFDAYGFLIFPGLLKNEIDQITREFEAVFPQLGLKHDGSKRTMIVPFVDHRPILCALLEHPGLLSAIGNLIGPDFNYMGSDGNYYTGDTTWHRDSFSPTNSYFKLAIYLDPVSADSGCLRVFPGSHTDEGLKLWHDLVLRDSTNVWGLSQRELPSQPLDSEPGDVLIFNHRLLHASFGGGQSRRMFTMNLGRSAQTEAEIDDLVSYIDQQCVAFGLTSPYGDSMTRDAPPERLVHLTQLPLYWYAGVERNRARMVG